MRLCQPETSFSEPTGSAPYQHVLGQDPKWAFDVLVPGADVAAVTMPVLDRPSERATQIRQATRQAFCGESGSQSDAACSGGETASVEGIPG